jgi:hypothetical protein
MALFGTYQHRQVSGGKLITFVKFFGNWVKPAAPATSTDSSFTLHCQCGRHFVSRLLLDSFACRVEEQSGKPFDGRFGVSTTVVLR